MRLQNTDQLVNFRSLQKQLKDQENLNRQLQDQIARLTDAHSRGLNVSEFPQGTTSTPGTANATNVLVDFGSSFTHYAEATVTGLSWVTLNTIFVITPAVPTSQEVEATLLQFSCNVHSITAGDGFVLSVYTPVEAKGTYNFNIIGVDS